MAWLTTLLALFQALLKAAGLIKDAMPSESEKESSDKADFDKQIEANDKSGGADPK